ncbi:cold-shock protein [Insolitispirillum peregrinum]
MTDGPWRGVRNQVFLIVVSTMHKGSVSAMNTRTYRPSTPTQSGISATVKWFNATKGFGFVAPQDGSSDAFLHVSVLQRFGMQSVAQGAVIVCDLEAGPKGPQVSAIFSVDQENSVPEEENAVIEGVVKFFSAEKGFGFVTPDGGGKDVFIGIGSLNRSGIAALETGQRVRLNTRMGKKGPMAEEVELIG